MLVDIVDWVLLGKCNLRCLHCHGPDKHIRSLPEPSLRLIATRLAVMKPTWVVLTGGEPLLVPEFGVVVRQLAESGIKVALSTNTTLFLKFEKLIRDYVSSLNIPLDGSTAAIHAASRKNESSFHTFLGVLNHYRNNPDRRPPILRVGSVYSSASRGDFLAIARLLEPYADLIDTWKIYELVNHEVQPDLRRTIIHQHGWFAEEMETLLTSGSPLAEKILVAPASGRNKAFFMINPQGMLVVPTNVDGVTRELEIGHFLETPLNELIAKWSNHVTSENYYGNHKGHYDKLPMKTRAAS